MIIGLTGGIGSGKTTVANFFKAFNVGVYIADKEAKKLMHSSKEIKEKILHHFGKEAYLNNQLNRAFIANIVFKNPKKLTLLNAIVHPIVHNHFKKFVKKNKDKDYIVYESAILFENGTDALCDVIITVTAPKNIRIKRVLERDKISEEAIKERMKNQWSDVLKILQSHYVIYNTSLSYTRQLVFDIHNKLTKKRL